MSPCACHATKLQERVSMGWHRGLTHDLWGPGERRTRSQAIPFAYHQLAHGDEVIHFFQGRVAPLTRVK